jgi:hypothetical protein
MSTGISPRISTSKLIRRKNKVKVPVLDAGLTPHFLGLSAASHDVGRTNHDYDHHDDSSQGYRQDV